MMNGRLLSLVCAAVVLGACSVRNENTSNYTCNREPLATAPFLELPLGAISPEGWLLEQLNRMRDGLTGHMDEVYPIVDGPDNAWLGGKGDAWERGPYWIDGLVPLAYILDDDALKQKAQKWIEWSLASQDEEGYFGPSEDNPDRPGIQGGNARDWWPKMVMLKVLKQYYSATGDGRVIPFMTKYFRYQWEHLEQTPLGHWTFWAEQRGGDNLQLVYWLYNTTGEKFLLELADLLHRQTYDWTGAFLEGESIRSYMGHHCVNLAMGFKEPIVYWQQAKESKYLDACKKAASDIRSSVGLPTGLWGGDEMLHSGDPTAGSELCTAVEMMFSLEDMGRITGDVFWMDYLERVAYNALPAQINDDFTAKQYYQQTNQIALTRSWREFTTPHKGTDTVLGTLNGYPCCISNMHQAWPKFIQNLWYATPDGGAAALVYGPSRVSMLVSDGLQVDIREQTHYPFDGKVVFSFSIPDGRKAAFPFRMRIPAWCQGASASVNGQQEPGRFEAGSIVCVSREWQSGDSLVLDIPMDISLSRWHDGALCFERGPLVYALKMDENWSLRQFEGEDREEFGDSYWEVTSGSPWNYAIKNWAYSGTDYHDKCEVIVSDVFPEWPWNHDDAPVVIRTEAVRLPQWKEYNGDCGPVMYNIQGSQKHGRPEPVELIPYGCTKLRITEFPIR
ncbi:MAG: glycoside hydrolase family 127 protein [Bacteroidales bacterium]|nr:glycoside hydrolase family 127 protein [Bacteroidales bacterium]